MNNKEISEALEWIEDSEGTNEACERGLIVEALKLLEEDTPNIKKAIERLRDVIPFEVPSKLVEVPEFITEHENSNS
jgi:hypothetical protein